jgi:hypothetical protein
MSSNVGWSLATSQGKVRALDSESCVPIYTPDLMNSCPSTPTNTRNPKPETRNPKP